MIISRQTLSHLITVHFVVVGIFLVGLGFSKEEAAQPSEVVAARADTSNLKMPAALDAAGFGKFAAAVRDSGLAETFEEDGPFTCFAPSDAAFDAMLAETKTQLKENPQGKDAQAWVKYHFVKNAFKQSDLMLIPGVISSSEKYLRVWVSKGEISLNRICNITQFDIIAKNGVIHAVDRVLNSDDETKAFQKKSF